MSTFRSLVLFSACLLTFVTATSASCDVTNDTVPLPAGQTNLTVPSGLTTEYITLGTGSQNYSCSAAGKYMSMGAVATLFDASCFFQGSNSAKGNNLSKCSKPDSIRASLGPDAQVLGRHYFVQNPTGNGISPAFDFRADSQPDNPNAFVIATKIGDIASPSHPKKNVDWLQLEAMSGQGTLAKYVFRILTSGGQPPSMCVPGTPPIEVPYMAVYWFYN